MEPTHLMALLGLLVIYFAFRTPSETETSEQYWLRRALRQEQSDKLRDPHIRYDSQRGIRQ